MSEKKQTPSEFFDTEKFPRMKAIHLQIGDRFRFCSTNANLPSIRYGLFERVVFGMSNANHYINAKKIDCEDDRLSLENQQILQTNLRRWEPVYAGSIEIVFIDNTRIRGKKK